MQINLPLACFLSIIRPPSIEIETAIFQLSPVDKVKCPFVRDKNDVGFRLYTRHNPTVYQDLAINDDESLFASHFDFRDPTVMMFHGFFEEPNTGSGIMLREAFVLRGDSNVIMVDASRLEAGPWYFTAADNTWYIGRMAAMFIDYMVSRGLELSNTHLVGHSLGAQSAAVAGATLTSGRIARITGLDPALPLFKKASLLLQLDPSDAEFVDVIHTDAGILGQKRPVGHVDFYPNGGISPQPGCELEVVIPQQLLLTNIFCSHWRSFQYYSESVIRPHSFTASECGSYRDYSRGKCAGARTTHMGYAVNRKYEGYNQLKLYLWHIQHWYSRMGITITVLDVNCTQPNTHAYYVFHLHANKHRQKRSLVKKSRNFRFVTYTTSDDIETNVKELDQQSNNTVQKKFQQFQQITPGHLNPTTNVKSNPSSILKKLQTIVSPEKSDNHRSILEVSNPVKADKLNFRKRRSIFKSSESFESDNFLFRILEFLLRHRKSALPVITMVREINTLVKNGNNEWNNLIKERNSFIGTLPKFEPVTYNFEVPNENRFRGIFRKLFDRQIGSTVTSSGK